MKQFVAGIGTGLLLSLILFPTVTAAISSEDANALDLFSEAIERIHANYVREIAVSELTDKAVHGMASALDPHSSYMDAQEFKDIQTQTNGAAGIGLELTTEYGRVKVITPLDNSPAALSGIKPGDYISKIDGQSVIDQPLSDAIMKMRGGENSKITLTVERDTERKTWDVTLTRVRIVQQTLRYERKGDVGYIRLAYFGNDANSLLAKAVAELKSQIGPNLKGYVLDLRNDPGGLLDQGIQVSDSFLDSGKIVSLHGRNAADNNSYAAKQGDIADGKPVIVLINEGSAAASEIVAGALQDNRRATIIGTKSFGEGTVQTIIPLQGGSGGALRLTTAKFYKPSGEEIQVAGITPDILVSQHIQEKEEAVAQSETQMPGHFPAETSLTGAAIKDVIYPTPSQKSDDFQLSYALDRMNGQQAGAPKE